MAAFYCRLLFLHRADNAESPPPIQRMRKSRSISMTFRASGLETEVLEDTVAVAHAATVEIAASETTCRLSLLSVRRCSTRTSLPTAGIWAPPMLPHIRKSTSADAEPYRLPTVRILISTGIPWGLHGFCSIPVLVLS